ncbi:MAG: hypothetical protein ACOZCL_02700 [Bacillota bacterium]
MKSKYLIITWVLLIVIALAGCGDRNLPNNVPSIQPPNENSYDIINDKGKETLGISESIHSNKSSIKEIDYVGEWYAPEYSGPEAELEIIQKNNDIVEFSFGFLRIAQFSNISAKIENNVAKFKDNHDRISGTLEFTDAAILLSIEKSVFEEFESQKIEFKRVGR